MRSGGQTGPFDFGLGASRCTKRHDRTLARERSAARFSTSGGRSPDRATQTARRTPSALCLAGPAARCRPPATRLDALRETRRELCRVLKSPGPSLHLSGDDVRHSMHRSIGQGLVERTAMPPALRRGLSLSLLLVLFALPLFAGESPRPETPASHVLSLLDSFWHRLLNTWGKEGSAIDPFGRQGSGTPSQGSGTANIGGTVTAPTGVAPVLR